MDERYQLTTPENIPISYELSGVGSRFVAMIIDGLITGAGMIALFVLVILTMIPLSDFYADATFWVFAVFGVAAFVLVFCYNLFFEIAWSGQTPGKRALGIRVIREDGSPITSLAAVVRNVLRVVDSLPAYYIIGIIVILIDSKARRLGDLAAGTVVVKERREVAVDRLTLADILPSAGTENGNDQEVPGGTTEPSGAKALDVSRLTADDRYLIKEYLLRREQLNPQAARQLAAKIANRIAAQLEASPVDETAEDFLARLSRSL